MIAPFKTFYEEEGIAATKRQGILHLYEPTGKFSMSPKDFIDVMDFIETQNGGKITPLNTKISEKVDGFGFRFGLDKSNNMFIESSHSGPVFNVGRFSEYSMNKSGKTNPISEGLDNILKRFKENEELNNLLKEYNTPTGIKVVGECFLVPIGKEDGNLISFVVTRYEKKKLGKWATIILFDAVDGEGNSIPNAGRLIQELKGLTNDELKFDDTSIDIDKDVDLTGIIKDIKLYISDLEQREGNKIDDILSDPSRKRDAMDKKRAIKDEVLKLQQKVSKEIQKIIKKSKFGGDWPEGIVLNLANGVMLKVVSDKFKEAKAAYNAQRKEMK